MSFEQTSEYQKKNSYKSICSAINRHLQNLGREINIVRGKEYKSSNMNFDGNLKRIDIYTEVLQDQKKNK